VVKLDNLVYTYNNYQEVADMIIKKILLISLLCFTYLFGSEDINALLQEYRSNAELSKITKIESAGFVDIYTREDLGQMQAHTA